MSAKHDSIARLMAEALAGQLSRRTVQRRAAALQLEPPLVGALLAAQSRTGARSAATPAGAPVAVPFQVA